jgi:lipid-A-disaccharide synthase-like uncharacterized protein
MDQSYWIYALGFFAQGLFGARSVVQWVLSERAGRVLSPTLFWVFSLCGSFLFLIYGLIRHDAVILLGQSISFYIYVRNLQLKGAWGKIPKGIQWLLYLVPPGIAFIAMQLQLNFSLGEGTWFLLVIGISGQLLLNCRYLYQWYFSEKAKQSVLPLGFWVISAFASVLVVIYSVFRKEPVLLIAQSLGLVVYLRNIWIYRKQARLSNS